MSESSVVSMTALLPELTGERHPYEVFLNVPREHDAGGGRCRRRRRWSRSSRTSMLTSTLSSVSPWRLILSKGVGRLAGQCSDCQLSHFATVVAS
jgi:hypothetical protein